MEEGISIKANLIIALQTSNVQAFESVVKTSDVPLYNLKDSHGCNIFHDLAVSVVKEDILIEMLNVLIVEFNDRYFEDSDDYMRFMLNSKKQNDGRTPLLDAVYYNKRKIVKKFIQLGSDPLVKGNDGQGAVHFAACSGFDYLLVYLAKDLGLDCDQIDKAGKSPLHLACSKGHYTAAAFLVAWGADVNLLDSSGNSALHLAVSNQNYKLVRLLLVRGSRKNVRNRMEERPLDLALSNMSGDIVDLINSPSCLARLNPFAQNVSSSGNSPIKFIIFSMIFALRSVFQVIFIYNLDHQIVFYLSLFLIVLSIASFLMASCKSPGYLVMKIMSLNELIEKYRPEFICPFCECKKNHGTRHCFICKRCVEKMDHHCPWLNNCIGKKNYNFFIIFLVVGSFDYLFHTVLCLLELFQKINIEIRLLNKNLVLYVSSAISFILFIIIFPVLCIHIFNIIKQKRNKMKVTPNRLDSSDTSSMFVTPSISEVDTSSSLMSESNIRVKKKKSCFRIEKNHEVSLMPRVN